MSDLSVIEVAICVIPLSLSSLPSCCIATIPRLFLPLAAVLLVAVVVAATPTPRLALLPPPSSSAIPSAMAPTKRKRPGAGDTSAAPAGSPAAQAGGGGYVPEVSAWMDSRRVRLLTAPGVPPRSQPPKSVVYWMSRDQRCEDNWSMLYARDLAKRARVPLRVCFSLVPGFLGASIRHFGFMMGGLEETEAQIRAKNIPFHLLRGLAKDTVPAFAAEYDALAVVCDMSPLREPMQWARDVAASLPKGIPLYQVDAHNVCPVWTASDKQETAARTIRPKINKLLSLLTDFPVLEGNEDSDLLGALPARPDWAAAKRSLQQVGNEPAEVSWLRPGWRAGNEVLQAFIAQRLRKFGDSRNDPNEDALSNLSPYLHYGQISAQRAVLEVRSAGRSSESTASFVEETIVRRELADNFCFYNPAYDSLQGAAGWARASLELHASDPREHIYSKEQLEKAQTHDDLWNAAQIQMVETGKMHGFLRMYWAKKILEWTPSPAEALDIANELNNKYELDGRDPSGYVGVAWSIMGTHDMGWTERPIFGKIRFMNYQGCCRKFDVAAFVDRYPQARANCLKAGGTPAKPKKKKKTKR
jgi:deoxyribodipyrimidine photo-lyase